MRKRKLYMKSIQPFECLSNATQCQQKALKSPSKKALKSSSRDCCLLPVKKKKRIEEITIFFSYKFLFHLNLNLNFWDLIWKKANLIQGQLVHCSSWPSLNAHFCSKTSVMWTNLYGCNLLGIIGCLRSVDQMLRLARKIWVNVQPQERRISWLVAA